MQADTLKPPINKQKKANKPNKKLLNPITIIVFKSFVIDKNTWNHTIVFM